MNVNYVNLETVCGITSVLPENVLPEFAFAGKSNVGKSSLINALMNRKSYAKTSSQPGKTQTINFYNIERQLYFVDLPGYGYAKVSLELKEKWGKMVENYLTKTTKLRQIFLLIDIRHAPSANDKVMYEWIVYHGFLPVIIATKADKLKPSQIEKQASLLRESLALKPEAKLIPFSAQTKQGKEEIWECIERHLSQEEAGRSRQSAQGLDARTAEGPGGKRREREKQGGEKAESEKQGKGRSAVPLERRKAKDATPSKNRGSAAGKGGKAPKRSAGKAQTPVRPRGEKAKRRR